MITIIEYDTTNKPTGRYCRMPDATPTDLETLLPLYGFTGTFSRYTCQMRDYNATGMFCHVYKSSMPGVQGAAVGLDELLAP